MFRTIAEYKAAQRRRKASLRREVERLVEGLKARGAVRVILFGSLARGTTGPWSDVDLLVIIPDAENSREWRRWLYEDVGPRLAVDLLVFTETELRQDLPVSTFLRTIVKEGVTLYERRQSERGSEMADSG